MNEEYLLGIFREVFGEIRRNYVYNKGQLSVDCPSCSSEKLMTNGDGKGNLEINVRKGKFHCWVCGQTRGMRGPLRSLLRRFATKDQILRYNEYSVEEEVYSDDSPSHPTVLDWPEGYVSLTPNNSDLPGYNVAIAYLQSRGWGEDLLTRKKIGYAYDGRYKGRIIVPSFDRRGRLNYYTCRTYVNHRLKYINADVDKGPVIFNEKDINWYATVYLTEGVFDGLPIPNALPLLGKKLMPMVMESLISKARGEIVICLDPDAWADAVRIYQQLDDIPTLSGRIRIVKLSRWDLGEIYAARGRSGIFDVLSASVRINPVQTMAYAV